MSITLDRDTLQDFELSSRLEWLETDGMGGWAGSSVSGAHTRRYHGLLVAATRPPLGRKVLLSKLDETLHAGRESFELGTHRYPGEVIHPRGYRFLAGFTRDLFPVWEIEAGRVRLKKTVAAVHGTITGGVSTTLVLYEVVEAPEAITLELQPFVAARDFHALTTANRYLKGDLDFTGGRLRLAPYPGVPEIHLLVPGAELDLRPDWYRSFEYDRERERGLDFQEDLWTPGSLRCELASGGRLGVIASTADPRDLDPWALFEDETKRRLALLEGLPPDDDLARTLTLASDQFLVRGQTAQDGPVTVRDAARTERNSTRRAREARLSTARRRLPDGHPHATTVIAGYPWFGDWGRDTLIALPGLTLATGRFEEAEAILRTLAGHLSEGMLPNRFPESGEEPNDNDYNTVDATLWFFVAVWEMLEAGGGETFVRGEWLPLLREVVAWHDRGTRFGIHATEDGLLWAGEPGVQLTWMDAKVSDGSDGGPVTPRIGFAVEINALWINALAILAELEERWGEAATANALQKRTLAARDRFEEVFWSEEAGHLADVVGEDGPDLSLRPNQLFALSLPFPLLTGERAERVLASVEAKLLTPVGLRSLAPDHPDYHGAYEGGVRSRDGAYHQGTVWSWLLGPYLTALVRLRGEAGRRRAREILTGLRPHLAEACVGSVSEIFDGDPPHTPRGAVAQAWSVAEVLRVWTMLGMPEKA